MIKTTHGTKTERIHALDSLRAIMMLLGLVLHTVITYGVVDYGSAWGVKDSHTTHLFMDFMVVLIHKFRMPIFFVVAGFFGALLFFERGPKKMMKNRVDRILFPFIVFVIVLSPSILFAFIYSNAVMDGATNPVSIALAHFNNWQSFIPPATFHMWFLYYLFMITVASYILGLLFNKLPRFTNWTSKQFNWIIQNPLLKVLVMAIFTAILLFLMDSSWVATSTGWVPDVNTFVFYLFFYAFGWVLFKSKSHLGTFMKFDWLYTILALVILSVQFVLTPSLSFEMHVVINAILVWLFIFGITGLFLRYGSKHSHLMRYNSDSSYWIYLIHLSIVAYLPGVVANWQVSAITKALFVFLITSLICVVTYHYFVRSTFIGKFLNGRKYSRNIHARLKPEKVAVSKSQQ